jgi:hypothetical protein
VSWVLPTYKHVQRLADNPVVKCGCGRITNADMMLDVRALPATLRGQHEFVCDACRERWIMEGRISREGLYRALGAPDTVLARMRRFDGRT